MRCRKRNWLRAVFFLLLPLVIAGCRPGPRVVVSTRSGAKRVLGLQYRNELGDDRGMLFLFPSPAAQSFWMKNTPISLDIIFIGSDLRIAGIVHQAAPFSTASLSVAAPSQFVLEVRGGLSQRAGIETGNAVRFDGISLDGVRE